MIQNNKLNIYKAVLGIGVMFLSINCAKPVVLAGTADRRHL